MTNFEAAQEYLKRGWSVLPVRPKQKSPNLKTWSKWQSKLPTGEEIKAWFEKTNNNIGIILGPISGIFVLDLDSQRAVDFVKTQEVPQTPVVRTRNGWHIYFKLPSRKLRNFINIRGLKLDIKAEGGYVLAPPSIHPSGAMYSWVKGRSPQETKIAEAPKWLLNLILSTDRPQKKQKRDASFWVNLFENGDPEARNNTATQITGYLIAKGLPLEVVEVIVKNWNVAVNETPLATQEINTVVRSVAKKDARSGKNRVNPLSNKLYTRFSATSSVEEKPSIEPKEIVLAEQYKPQEVKKESQIIQEQLNNLQIIFHGRTDGKSCEDTA